MNHESPEEFRRRIQKRQPHWMVKVADYPRHILSRTEVERRCAERNECEKFWQQEDAWADKHFADHHAERECLDFYLYRISHRFYSQPGATL